MSYRHPSPARLAALAALVALVLAAVGPSALALGRGVVAETFSVTHDAVQTSLTTPGSDGHQLGDLRVTSIPVVVEGSGAVGQLDSTLTTVGIDQPATGDEVRISVLIFSFNDYADQIVVNGTAAYPKAGSTLAVDTVVERPITGGSGAFAGATGWAVSEHRADGTWRHTFHLASAVFRGPPDRLHGDGADSWNPATLDRGDRRGTHRVWRADATPGPADSPTPSASS